MAEVASDSKPVCLGLKCCISGVQTEQDWDLGELTWASQLKIPKNTLKKLVLKGKAAIQNYQLLVFQIPSCKIVSITPPNMENKNIA